VEIRWNQLKSKRLKRTRGVSFEEILKERWIAIVPHPKRSAQKVFLFERRGYIWVASFVEDERGIFLKTLYPSRGYTRRYKKGELP
jgi:uncharacterized DUF497 family protein